MKRSTDCPQHKPRLMTPRPPPPTPSICRYLVSPLRFCSRRCTTGGASGATGHACVPGCEQESSDPPSMAQPGVLHPSVASCAYVCVCSKSKHMKTTKKYTNRLEKGETSNFTYSAYFIIEQSALELTIRKTTNRAEKHITSNETHTIEPTMQKIRLLQGCS